MRTGNDNFWSDKKIFLAGGGGFLGRHIKDALERYDCEVIAPDINECDFRDAGQTEKILSDNKPDIMIHAAIDYGDLSLQATSSARILRNNLAMNDNLFYLSHMAGVKKFVNFGSYWAYPAALREPLRESQYLAGELYDDLLVYGMLKRMLYVSGWAYKKEYDFNSIHLVLPNIYGKDGNNRNAVGALIAKVKQAKLNNENFVHVWGDGSAVRDFLHIDDAIKLILLAIEKYNDIEPLNIGTGKAHSIRDLIDIIIRTDSFNGDIVWEKDKPNGIPYRVLDTARMIKELDFLPQISLEEGIKKIMQ